ncbi:MAG: AzlC family ABC transporter permease [Hyphomonadaceae bacterium]|nr:AzlC family ABC transporter permease [Hyphomonadaceae bacterium]
MQGVSTQAAAFALGLRAGYSVAAFVLFATALGFGAIARDAGFTLGQAAFLSLTMFALPNQVVLIDQLARGATVAGAAMAVTLAAVRLFPMVAATMPTLRGSKRRPVLEVLAAHFVAITTWIEGARRLPSVARELRLAHHLGIGVAVCGMMVLGSLTGFLLTGSVPGPVSAALVFTTPLYFILSLVISSQSRMDVAAVVLGCGLAPLLYLIVPGFDLLAAGLIGGTLAYLWGASAR